MPLDGQDGVLCLEPAGKAAQHGASEAATEEMAVQVSCSKKGGKSFYAEMVK